MCARLAYPSLALPSLAYPSLAYPSLAGKLSNGNRCDVNTYFRLCDELNNWLVLYLIGVTGPQII